MTLSTKGRAYRKLSGPIFWEIYLKELKILINDITNDVLKVSVVDNLRESYKHIGATDLPFVKEKILSILFLILNKFKITLVKPI